MSRFRSFTPYHSTPLEPLPVIAYGMTVLCYKTWFLLLWSWCLMTPKLNISFFFHFFSRVQSFEELILHLNRHQEWNQKFSETWNRAASSVQRLAEQVEIWSFLFLGLDMTWSVTNFFGGYEQMVTNLMCDLNGVVGQLWNKMFSFFPPAQKWWKPCSNTSHQRRRSWPSWANNSWPRPRTWQSKVRWALMSKRWVGWEITV